MAAQGSTKMEGRYFATFGASQLPEYECPGGPSSVMLVSPIGLTENEFRLILKHRFDNKYCTTYPLEEAHRMHIDYGMREYTLDQLETRRLD